ncbi:MAG: glycoside hydrolase family 97 N-terminal domain-containing protein, partial [Bacteroidota bacterium]
MSPKLIGCTKFVLSIFLFFFSINGFAADTTQVCSPSGKICVKVWMDNGINYKVLHNGKIILEPSLIDLVPENKLALSSNKSFKTSVRKVSDEIISPVPDKRKLIP